MTTTTNTARATIDAMFSMLFLHASKGLEGSAAADWANAVIRDRSLDRAPEAVRELFESEAEPSYERAIARLARRVWLAEEGALELCAGDVEKARIHADARLAKTLPDIVRQTMSEAMLAAQNV